MQAFLAEAGIDAEAYNLTDGSGLAYLNLATPATVVKLLRFMYASPARANWISLLPVGGRMERSAPVSGGAAAGRVHAKTGTMAHVSALSGYLERLDGDWVAFSILVKQLQRPPADVRGVMDRICTLIME